MIYININIRYLRLNKIFLFSKLNQMQTDSKMNKSTLGTFALLTWNSVISYRVWWSSHLTSSRSWADILTEYEKVSSSSSSTNCWGFAVHTLIWREPITSLCVCTLGQQRQPTRRKAPSHLVLSDLHVQDDVVDEFGQGFLHRALELVVLQQRVDKLEDAEDQILKT